MQKISTTHNLIRFYFGECSHEEEKLILGDLREIGLDIDQLSDELNSGTFIEQGPTDATITRLLQFSQSLHFYETKITGLKAEITSN
ncbi:MAG: hypothetical protein ACK5B6_11330 [Bacteroidia bacterium]|jgi:hypothetical protein